MANIFSSRREPYPPCICIQSPPIVLEGFAGKTAYLMSKYGMTMAALGIAEEYKGRGVAANTVSIHVLGHWCGTLRANIKYREEALPFS